MVESRHKVVFYGNSLVLAGVQATFNGYSGFEVISVDKRATEAELLALEPNVIVFDMESRESDFLFAQMQELPGVLLICVDPESHDVLLTGQAVGSISLEEITQIVRDLIGRRVVHPISPRAQGT